MINLDQWQLDYIACKEHKILVAGRQTGKSEAQAYDNAEFVADQSEIGKFDGIVTALIISKTERQAEELLIKTVLYLQEKHPKLIAKDKDHKMTKHCVWVQHKIGGKKRYARVMCLPTGLAGEGIRGLTIHKLSVDEAQLPSEDVYLAVTPMLLTTGGKMSLTGTPRPERNFFRNAFENKLGQWKVFHVNSEAVHNSRPISDSWPQWRKDEALAHLAREKARLTEKHYRQEYLGEFVDDLMQVFSDEQINEICVLDRRPQIRENRKYYLGVDVGRTIDPSTFEDFDCTDLERIEQVENIVKRKVMTTETTDEVLRLEALYNHKGIGIDGNGIGAGVFDQLIKEPRTSSKAVNLNNASRNLDREGEHRTKLLKEDMYTNMLRLVERKHVKLLNDESIKNSLKSCIIEYEEGKSQPRIYGEDTHIAEGIVRALWLATERKALNLWCAWS